jgi:hypothetical protein
MRVQWSVQVGADSFDEPGRQLADELVAEALLTDVAGHLLAALGRRIGPVGLQPVVLRT